MALIRNRTALLLLGALVALVATSGAVAFSVVTPITTHGVHVASSRTALMSPRFMAGMSQPEVETKTKTTTTTVTRQKEMVKQTQKSKTDDPDDDRDHEFQEAPMFKLMLLGDKGYDVEHVILRMCSVVEDLDEDAASTVYQQAQQSGKAMMGKYPFERAELYKEQLLRSNPMILSEMENE